MSPSVATMSQSRFLQEKYSKKYRQAANNAASKAEFNKADL
jgi:hypothetical protein